MGTWNFKEAASATDEGFAPITEGRYNMAIEDAIIKPASTGTIMLNITMVVNDDGDFKNRKVWQSFALDKPKSQRFVIQFLKACGTDVWQKDNVSDDDLINAVKGSKGINAYLTPAKTNTGNDTTNASKFMSLDEGAKVTGGSELFS